MCKKQNYLSYIEFLDYGYILIALSRQDDPVSSRLGVVEAGIVALVYGQVELRYQRSRRIDRHVYRFYRRLRQLSPFAVLGTPNCGKGIHVKELRKYYLQFDQFSAKKC